MRYFFHVYNGMCSPDDTGDEFVDDREAVEEAVWTLRELLDDEEIVHQPGFRIEVADEQGNVLHVIHARDVVSQ
jgi:hypothetical protein